MRKILEDIKYFGKEYFRIPIRNFRIGISNLIKWFPTIWNDRDWDNHFIYEILKRKLEFQAKYISERDFYTMAQKDSRNMKICASLIQKCQEETYSCEYMDYHESRHWFTPSESRPGSYEFDSEIEGERFDEFFAKYPIIHKKVLNGEGIFNMDIEDEKERKQRIAMNIGNINQNRARKLLFKIMEEHIEGWWE
jgi:hypothetical protein